MKKIILILCLFLVTTLSIFTYIAFGKVNECKSLSSSQVVQQCLSYLDFVTKVLPNHEVSTIIKTFSPFFPHANKILGFEKPFEILVLLQNQYELRANGGFFGSYAKISLTEGKPSLKFQDIYVPDGQIIGHVTPPAPIQSAFKQGWFRLRDSDWEPDFSLTAPTIRWFFEKGGETNPDLLVTINLQTIEEIIKIVGPIEVPEYHLKLDHENLYSLLQNQAELDFFPGSTQKKDVITATGMALSKTFANLNLSQYLAITKLLLSKTSSQQILFHALDSSLQNTLSQANWTGQINWTSCQSLNCLSDHFLLVQTNLGANKANCCVTTTINHQVQLVNNLVEHKVQIDFDNQSPLENPDPPRFFGGNYISYLRLYLPENATLATISASPTLPKTLVEFPHPFSNDFSQITQTKNYQSLEIGFFHLTKASTKSKVNLTYTLPLTTSEKYELEIKRQHGASDYQSTLEIFGQNYNSLISSPHSLYLLDILR